MAEGNIDFQTDTHLAKKYNDILYDCMMRCNTSGFVNNSAPHYDNLLAYYGAVNIFFMNSFMLFEGINFNLMENGKALSIAEKLQEWSDDVESEVQEMKKDRSKQTTENFMATFEKCKLIHKLIMYGLQRRNMLVRMSEREPRGQSSINYWGTKTAFKKGVVKTDEQVFKRSGNVRINPFGTKGMLK